MLIGALSTTAMWVYAPATGDHEYSSVRLPFTLFVVTTAIFNFAAGILVAMIGRVAELPLATALVLVALLILLGAIGAAISSEDVVRLFTLGGAIVIITQASMVEVLVDQVAGFGPTPVMPLCVACVAASFVAGVRRLGWGPARDLPHPSERQETMTDLQDSTHLLEGLLKGIENWETVGRLVTAAADRQAAQRSLVEVLELSSVQATAVMDQQWRGLTQDAVGRMRDDLAGRRALIEAEGEGD